MRALIEFLEKWADVRPASPNVHGMVTPNHLGVLPQRIGVPMAPPKPMTNSFSVVDANFKPTPMPALPQTNASRPTAPVSNQPPPAPQLSGTNAYRSAATQPIRTPSRKTAEYRRHTGVADVNGEEYVNSEDVLLLGKLGFDLSDEEYGALEKTSEVLDIYSYLEKVAGIPKVVGKAVDKGLAFSGEFLKDMDYEVPKGYEIKGDLCCPMEKEAKVLAVGGGYTPATGAGHITPAKAIIEGVMQHPAVLSGDVQVQPVLPEEGVLKTPLKHNKADLAVSTGFSQIPGDPHRLNYPNLELATDRNIFVMPDAVNIGKTNALGHQNQRIADYAGSEAGEGFIERIMRGLGSENVAVYGDASANKEHAFFSRHGTHPMLADEIIAKNPQLAHADPEVWERLAHYAKQQGFEGANYLADVAKRARTEAAQPIVIAGSSRGDFVAQRAREGLSALREAGLDHKHPIIPLGGGNTSFTAEIYRKLGLPVIPKLPKDIYQAVRANAHLQLGSTGGSDIAESKLLPTATAVLRDPSGKHKTLEKEYLRSLGVEVPPSYDYVHTSDWNKHNINSFNKGLHNQGLMVYEGEHQLPELLKHIPEPKLLRARAAAQGSLAAKEKQLLVDRIVRATLKTGELKKEATTISALKALIRELRAGGITVIKDPKTYAEKMFNRMNTQHPGAFTDISALEKQIVEHFPVSFNAQDKVMYIPKNPLGSAAGHSEAENLLRKNYTMSGGIMHEGGHALHYLDDPHQMHLDIARNPYHHPSEALALERIANNNAINFMRKQSVPEHMVENYKQNFANAGFNTHREELGWDAASKKSPAFSVDNPSISPQQVDNLYKSHKDIVDAANAKYQAK